MHIFSRHSLSRLEIPNKCAELHPCTFSTEHSEQVGNSKQVNLQKRLAAESKKETHLHDEIGDLPHVRCIKEHVLKVVERLIRQQIDPALGISVCAAVRITHGSWLASVEQRPVGDHIASNVPARGL